MSHDVTDFETDVITASHEHPVLVDFWAEWCGPCRMLGPVLERLAERANGRWALAKVDTEVLGDVAARYDVRGIPNVKLFVDGRVVDEFVGARGESEVSAWLERALPSPHAATLEAVRALLARGAWRDAEGALAPVLAADPAHAPARFARAEIALHLDPGTVAEWTRDLGGDPDLASRGEALRNLAAARAHPPTADTPGAAALVRALEAVDRADWDGALVAVVAALGERRDPAAPLAREVGRALFVYLGADHPACERHYRAFTGALHV